MNKRFLTLFFMLAGSSLLITGCGGDNSSFETPNTAITLNSGVISQNNFTILSSDLTPAIFADPLSDSFTFTTLTITVNIGDRNNQVLTDRHTIFFKTEWGLIEPSCVTEDGTCTVTWQTSGDPIPADHKNTIMAYAIGEESFIDVNGNGLFDDDDSIFFDIEEPYVDANRNGIYDFGEPIADVIGINDLFGSDGVHNLGDGFFNGGGCTHSSLCSTTRASTYVWDDVQIDMNGPPPAAP